MAGFIDSLERAVLDHVLNDGTYTPPTNWFVGLFTTNPTSDDGTGGTEVSTSGTAYARVSTAAADWAAATGTAPATKANGNAITFPTATASWGTVVGFGLFTASTGGTAQIYGSLGTSKAVASGDTPSFGVGALIVKLGDPADTY